MSNPPLTYGKYLKIPELLSMQERQSSPPHHDELLFIVVHQAHELWFKLMLHELERIREVLLSDQPLIALKGFKRVHAILRSLGGDIDILETMTPPEFNAFRNVLRPASGFQSVQFREIEFLSGGGNPSVMQHMFQDPALVRIEERMKETTLYEALLTLLSRRGFDIPQALLAPGGARGPRQSSTEVKAAFQKIYSEHTENPALYELYLLAEAFIEYDQLILLWRNRHVRMVERTIGFVQGTGGSEGANYLHRVLASAKIFTELWEVRTDLSGS